MAETSTTTTQTKVYLLSDKVYDIIKPLAMYVFPLLSLGLKIAAIVTGVDVLATLGDYCIAAAAALGTLCGVSTKTAVDITEKVEEAVKAIEDAKTEGTTSAQQ